MPTCSSASPKNRTLLAFRVNQGISASFSLFLIANSGTPGSGPLKDQQGIKPTSELEANSLPLAPPDLSLYVQLIPEFTKLWKGTLTKWTGIETKLKVHNQLKVLICCSCYSFCKHAN